MITQRQLKKLLHYNLATGVFTWLVRPRVSFKTLNAFRTFNTKHAHTPAGYRVKKTNGKSSVYIQVKVNRVYRVYAAHRLAWLYEHGVYPDQIKHRNGDTADNCLINLSVVHNGVTGVSWMKDRDKWRAYTVVNKKRKNLGSFEDHADAVNAVKMAGFEVSFL